MIEVITLDERAFGSFDFESDRLVLTPRPKIIPNTSPDPMWFLPGRDMSPFCKDWLSAHCVGFWTYAIIVDGPSQYGIWSLDGIMVLFQKESDAILFKMTWG